MATAFRSKGSRIVGVLDDDEREVVIELLQQTRSLLVDDDDDSGADPVEQLLADLGRPAPDAESLQRRDPALQRLLPDAHRDDPQLARDFRALTEHSLRRQKAANLATAMAALDAVRDNTVELDRGGAQAVMIGLGDVRLVLGERLGLRTDADSDELSQLVERANSGEDLDDPRLAIAMYYDFLTWLQESLATALLS